MNRIYKNIIISTCVMLALDACYLSLTTNKFLDMIAQVQRVILQVRYIGVLLCYIFLILGLNYFILRQNRSIEEAFLFGIVIYGVYDTTNYATLKRWSPSLAILDTVWGGTLMALTTYFTYMLEPLF
uniref:DUF2177 family protein n=1 Tax=viral metagenome TaxID=1070528 RepID=A0A6C0DRC6_9ZZZZ